MGLIHLYFELTVCLLMVVLALVPSALSWNHVESFPSCVEIVNINPPPYSVVKIYNHTTIWFEITFSKPVFIRMGGKQRVFLSPDARGLANQIQAADLMQTNTSTPLKWSIKFTIRKPFHNYFGKKFRTFYLVIDGGVFYSHEYIPLFRQIYVPLSIYGGYYTSHEEKIYRGNHMVQPLSPPSHCWPAPVRRLPEPVGSTTAVDQFISVEIPEKGHWMNDTGREDTSTGLTFHFSLLQLRLLALVNVTEGKTVVGLPHSVTAQLNSINYTVQLPAWNLTFDIPLIMWRVKVTPKIVYELAERVYISQKWSYIESYEHPVSSLKYLVKYGSLFAQPRVYLTKGKRGKRRLFEVFDADTNVKILEFEYKTKMGYYYQAWFETTHTGAFYSSKGQPAASTSQPKKQFLQDNVRQCQINSTRNRGRLGHLYHTIEYGRHYQMLVLHDPSEWQVHRANGEKEPNPPLYVTATTSDGEKIDLSKKTQFGWKNTSISSRLVKALTQDYVCLLTTPTEVNWYSFALEEKCIFVPKKVAESTQCGGLRLFENVSHITNDPDFCNKKMGDCIGESFSSPDRFPVIPPFGAPELSGWTVDAKANPQHPAGAGGPSPSLTIPLISYRTWLTNPNTATRYIYVYPFSHLYQLDVHHIPISGAKVMFPHVKFSRHKFCNSVWKFETSDIISSASLIAYIHNTGEGGGDFVFSVNCSSLLQVYPSSGVTELWIDPASKSEVRFKLSGLLAAHQPTAQHQCKLSVEIKTAKQFSDKIQQFQSCTKTITTYHGDFRDPCKQKEKQLPAVDLQYYVLPPSQLEPLARNKHVQERASIPDERKLLFVKAITISLGVPEFHQDLIGNLKQLHVHCGRPDVLITRSYGEFLVHQAMGGISGVTTSKPSLVFAGNDIDQNMVYFFLPKRKPEVVEERVYTDCWVELWANRPHPLCDQPILLSHLAIPLRDHDQAVLEGEKSKLSLVYGNTSEAVRTLLVGCILISVILCVCGSTVHGILFLLRKRLPRTSMLKKYRKDLEKVTKADTEYWENPQMFLTSGPHGPFYKLHSFRATDSLDTENIKGLKVAGTLRYESKELQVLFGHVKRVYLDKGGKTKDIWIQASSGMYLLSPNQVAPEYREDYRSLLKRHGLKVKPSDFD